MKALVKSFAKEGIWMEDVPMPTIGNRDVLIKVKKTAICGTDVHIYNWDEWSQKTIPVPMTVGHEFVGEIVELGADVQGYEVGERVSAEGHITCGYCRNCKAGKRHLCRNTSGIGVNRDGAFAEYISVPMDNLFKIPDNVSDDMAAIMDPFGNATHTALSYDLVGEDVLITGAGPIGMMAAAVCKHAGARYVVITDVNQYRLDLAKKLGADVALNVAEKSVEEVQKELGMTEGFDVGLEMSGNPHAFNSLIKNMNNGGKISLLGIVPNDTKVEWDDIIFKGLFLKGIYGREMFETWYKMSSMVQGGLDISNVITHKFKIDDFQKGFDAMRSGQSGKVILEWD